MKRLFCLLTIIFILLGVKSTFLAQNINQIQIDVSSINDTYLKQEITSMYINCLDDYHLYINNQFVIKSDTLSFDFVYKDINCHLVVYDDNCDLSFQYNTIKKKHLFIELKTIGSVYTLNVYPNMYNYSYYSILGTRNDDVVNFDSTIIEDKVYQFYIDLNKNVLYVNDTEVKLEANKETQRVFFETYVDMPYVSPIYLKSLPKNNYHNIKQVMYTDEQINQSSRNEILTLTNSRSLYSIEGRLNKYMYYWDRIGKEDYIVSYDSNIQNIYLYDEAILDNQDIEERLFAIFGDDVYYDSYQVVSKEELGVIKTNLTEYSDWLSYSDFVSETKDKQYIDVDTTYLYRHSNYSGWSDYYYYNNPVQESDTVKVTEQYRYNAANYSDWSDYVYNKQQAESIVGNMGQYKSKWFYAQSIGVWSDYSSYSSENKVVACENDSDCRYKVKNTYAKKIGTWSSYSDFIYDLTSPELNACLTNSDCQYKMENRYASSNAQLTGEYSQWMKNLYPSSEYQIQIYYKYNCHGLIGDQTVYSTESYQTGKRGVCPLLMSIDSVEYGYRKAYVTYPEPQINEYTSKTCTNNYGYSKCFNMPKAAIRTRVYQKPTDYIYTSCTDTSNSDLDTVTVCMAKREFAYSYRSWSEYSDYIYQTDQQSENIRTKAKEKYAVRTLDYQGFTNWSNKKDDVLADAITWQKRWAVQTREKLKSVYNQDKDGVYEKCFRYRQYTPQIGLTTVEYVQPIKKQLGQYLQVNNQDIKELNMRINDEIAVNRYIFNKTQVLYDDIKTITGDSDWLLNQEVFANYLYNKPHWYALIRSIQVDALTGSYDEYNQQVIKNSDDIKLNISKKEVDLSKKIVFFDYTNPFINYDKKPSNFTDKDINKIKQVDLLNPMYSFVLSKKDLIEIRQWASNNRDKIGQGILFERYLNDE